MWLWVLLLACGGGGTATPKPPKAPPAAEVKAHMAEHYSKATIALESFVSGEIGETKAALAWLGEHPPPGGLPAGAEPFAEKMKQTAADTSKLVRIDELAAGIAQLAATCGSCHAALGVKPSIELEEPPVESQRILDHMARHQWSVNAMWTALATNSDEPWMRAALVMGPDALPPSAYQVAEVSEQSMAHAATAHAVVTASADATAPGKRVEALSAALRACAGCHGEMRGE